MKWYIPLRRNYILIKVFVFCFLSFFFNSTARWPKYNECDSLCEQVLASLGTRNVFWKEPWWINLSVWFPLPRESRLSRPDQKLRPFPLPPTPRTIPHPLHASLIKHTGGGELGTRELGTRRGLDTKGANTPAKELITAGNPQQIPGTEWRGRRGEGREAAVRRVRRKGARGLDCESFL